MYGRYWRGLIMFIRYGLPALLVLIIIAWGGGTLMGYHIYRRLCIDDGKVAINAPLLKGVPWRTRDKSDAQWIVKNFPDVPFARYESYGGKLYDLRDAGRVMGRAHDYEVREADLSVLPGYMLKTESGDVNGNPRIRYYVASVSDLKWKSVVVESKVFGFTWWVIGDPPYGLTSTSTCFDPNAIETIQKAFESKE